MMPSILCSHHHLTQTPQKKRATLAGTYREVDEGNEEAQKLEIFPEIMLASHDNLAKSDDPQNIQLDM